MTHIYDDYDTCLSDTYAAALAQASDDFGEWITQLLADNCPGGWQDAYLSWMVDDVLGDNGFLVDLLAKRAEGDFRETRDRIHAALKAPAEAPTEYELKKLMRDPRYWRDQEPTFVAQVRRGFAALYSGKAPNAPAQGGQDAQDAPSRPSVARAANRTVRGSVEPGDEE